MLIILRLSESQTLTTLIRIIVLDFFQDSVTHWIYIVIATEGFPFLINEGFDVSHNFSILIDEDFLNDGITNASSLTDRGPFPWRLTDFIGACVIEFLEPADPWMVENFD
jgi:hypothetical protein